MDEPSGAQEFAAGQMPQGLAGYWTTGPGAAKIRWGTDGSFARCTRALRGKVPARIDVEGLCANLHHRATGQWPAQKKVES